MNDQGNDLERIAAELHEEWDSPALWTRIQAELSAAAPERKPASSWCWALAAAAILVMAVALTQVWPRRAVPPDGDFLTREALRDVEQSEAAYARAIDKLSAVAGETLPQSSTPLSAAYREKLLLLDSAIADLKSQMDGNQYNLYLRNQLASLYRDKQSTLEEWLKNAKDN